MRGNSAQGVSLFFTYHNYTAQNYRNQQFRFEALFIDRDLHQKDSKSMRPSGYETGVAVMTSRGNLKLPSGKSCIQGTEDVRFGIQALTSCALR